MSEITPLDIMWGWVCHTSDENLYNLFMFKIRSAWREVAAEEKEKHGETKYWLYLRKSLIPMIGAYADLAKLNPQLARQEFKDWCRQVLNRDRECPDNLALSTN